MVTKRWLFREAEPATVERLSDEEGIHPLIARTLAARGFSGIDEVRRFLSSSLSELHDPFLLQGMERGVSRLTEALKSGETVCVYGDYDVDGITSTALLIHFFRTVGLDCFYHMPLRLEEGYGLSREGIERVAARGAKVIVSVDCGITSVTEAQFCSSIGIDLIVTDHHVPGDAIPDAFAVINPLQPGCPFPFKQLAGVGIAFNLAMALRMRLRQEGNFATAREPNLREYLDLVAIGTVADMVPLVDENRTFVKHGLTELTVSARIGVQALKEVAGVSGEVSCGSIGFRLAPRLNAAGRLEDASLGVELLLCSDRQKARSMAAKLDAGNTERQELEQTILREAVDMVRGNPEFSRRKSIVLASEAWHPGVIGIVASRVVEIFHRPAILIALNEGAGRGSGRSIPAFHLHDALSACSAHLKKFGGHKYAAGLSIDESAIAAFVHRFDLMASDTLSAEDLVPQLAIDAVLDAGDISLETAKTMASIAPFGIGNPQPVFVLKGARVSDKRLLKDRHLKLRLTVGERSFDAIGFNMGERREIQERIDVAFSLEINEWNGRTGVQLRLRDFREEEKSSRSISW